MKKSELKQLIREELTNQNKKNIQPVYKKIETKYGSKLEKIFDEAIAYGMNLVDVDGNPFKKDEYMKDAKEYLARQLSGYLKKKYI